MSRAPREERREQREPSKPESERCAAELVAKADRGWLRWLATLRG
jgi:hypothetical protein